MPECSRTSALAQALTPHSSGSHCAPQVLNCECVERSAPRWLVTCKRTPADFRRSAKACLDAATANSTVFTVESATTQASVKHKMQQHAVVMNRHADKLEEIQEREQSEDSEKKRAAARDAAVAKIEQPSQTEMKVQQAADCELVTLKPALARLAESPHAPLSADTSQLATENVRANDSGEAFRKDDVRRGQGTAKLAASVRTTRGRCPACQMTVLNLVAVSIVVGSVANLWMRIQVDQDMHLGS